MVWLGKTLLKTLERRDYVAMSEMNITAINKKLTENQEIVCVEPKEEKSMNQEIIGKKNLYHLVTTKSI